MPAELDRLVRAVTYTVLIGNADAHGKNVALLHPTPETVALAPLYDTVPTVLWPRLRTEAAIAVGAQRSLPAVSLDDIVTEARTWSHPADRARDVATSAVAATVEALDRAVVTPARRLPPRSASRRAQLLGG